MRAAALEVDERLSWARRDGDGVSVNLRLMDAVLEPGSASLELVSSSGRFRAQAVVTSVDGSTAVAATVPQSELGRSTWRLKIQTSAGTGFVPIDARLVSAPSAPVALLPGPAPDTRMRPPALRTRRTPAHRLAAGLPAPLRRGLVRARTGASRNPAHALMDGRRLVRRAWVRLRRAVGQSGRLGSSGDRAVVVLADAAHPEAAQAWLNELANDRVTVLSVDQKSGVDSVLASLVRLPAQDIVLVVLGDGAVDALARSHGDLFAHLAVHLRAGGAYAVDRKVGEHSVELERGRRDPAISRLVKEMSVSGDLLVVTKRGRHALTLREEQVGDLLAAREPELGVSILEARPSGRLELRMDDASYGPSRAGPWPEHLDYPEMTLRHYQGDIVSTGRMRLRTDDTILPESFRWPHAKTLRHPHYESVTPSFVRLDRGKPAHLLDGDYYYVDCLFSGHFGHLTTEVLCRLWGWDRARSEIPGLKVLFHTDSARGADGALERRLFTAYGVPESHLVSTDQPVLVRSVVGASPMWHNKSPFYVHPDIRETWARLTSGFLSGAEPSTHERIFVSRGRAVSQRRTCRNQLDVERFFADRDFHVFYPEELPLPEQVRLFAGARVVAGFGGSAMFNLMHCRRLEAAVVISHHAYVARNEHLFTSVLGGQLHYFWQPSDVAPPKVGRNKASSGSSFAFDFAAYGDVLSRVLAEL